MPANSFEITNVDGKIIKGIPEIFDISIALMSEGILSLGGTFLCTNEGWSHPILLKQYISKPPIFGIMTTTQILQHVTAAAEV